MAIHRKVFYRIIFLLTAFLWHGVNLFSNINHIQVIELSASTNGDDKSTGPNLNSIDEDQIIQSDENNMARVYVCRIPASECLILLNNLCFSVWHPPKVF